MSSGLSEIRRVRFPHISAQSCLVFSKIKERKPKPEGRNPVPRPVRPLRSGATAHLSPHCSPLRIPPDPEPVAPPPPQRHEGQTGPEAVPSIKTRLSPIATGACPRLSGPHSPIKIRICFLPKRREKREEMVRPMAVVVLAMGRSRRGFGASPGLLLSRSQQTKRRKRS